MDLDTLYNYKMDQTEEDKWIELMEIVRTDCNRLGIYDEYQEYIEKYIAPVDPYVHTAGFCKDGGYFYISDGDRGSKYLTCLTNDLEEIRWVIMEGILRHIGSRKEMVQRKQDAKLWRFYDEIENGKLVRKENPTWIYSGRHDTRKNWFEYEIRGLAKVFGTEKLSEFVGEHVDLMNRWFHDAHWGFDWEKLCFVELSDSEEYD